MFAKLFGGKPKEDPTKKKAMEEKKNEFEMAKGKDDLNRKIDENNVKIESLEKKIRDKTGVGSPGSAGGEAGQQQGPGDAPAHRNQADEGTGGEDRLVQHDHDEAVGEHRRGVD